MKILPPKNILLCNYCYILKLFVSLQMLSAYCGCEARWDVRSLRAGHYILEGVTLRFVFGYSKLRNFWIAVRNKCRSGCHGLLYMHIRSVSWGYVCPQTHFTGVLYTYFCVGVALPVHSYGFPKTSNIEQAEVKHPRFIVCRWQSCLITGIGACLGRISKWQALFIQQYEMRLLTTYYSNMVVRHIIYQPSSPH